MSFPTAYSHDADFEASLNAQGFPESYKNSLRQLHAKHPQWRFEAQQTGLDWNTVIQNESVLATGIWYIPAVFLPISHWQRGLTTGTMECGPVLMEARG